MSEEEIRSKISDKQDDITKIEEEITKKEASAEREIEADFDSKIKTTKDTLGAEQKNLDEAIQKAEEWTTKEKQFKEIVKNLTKELEKLKKDKASALKDKLKEIDNEKKSRIGAVDKEIKVLEKELKKLLKAAEAAAKAEE